MNSISSETKELFLSTPLAERNSMLPEGADKVLTSVHDEYGKENVKSVREQFNAKRIAYDSGGFQFLMRDIPLPPVEKVVKTMLSLGMTSKDIAIQLDKPTNPHATKEGRLEMIHDSTLLYQEQKELHDCLPVVHGWDEDEIIKHMDLLELDQEVAAGAWIAAATRGVAIASGTAEEKQLHVPVKRVYTRLGLLLKLLKDYDLFVLGAGSVNMCHLVWAHGAKLTDGSSWRFQAAHWQLMMPESTSLGFGSKRQTGRKIREEDYTKLEEIKEMNHYPLQSLSLAELLELFKANGSEGFKARASHNAFVMLIEEKIANDYACDPEKYYSYLLRRWRNSPYWMKRLELVRNEVKRNYVQETLDLYLKGGN